ncbi:MAG: DUF2625 domain-containing protein [Oscillospiraceae bacterium]|nr:DUF2625 domain-containing protein [Oscillospiraceae bacterium]
MSSTNQLANVQAWISSSPLRVSVVPRRGKRNNCEETLGISETTVLGTITNYTGGIVCCDGTLRMFGGDNEYGRSVADINNLEDFRPRTLPGLLLIADDIYGGLFGINCGAFTENSGGVYYIPPEKCACEALDMVHSQFVEWCLTRDIRRFFETPRSMLSACGVTSAQFNMTIDASPPLWMAPSDAVRTAKLGDANTLLRVKAGAVSVVFGV